MIKKKDIKRIVDESSLDLANFTYRYQEFQRIYESYPEDRDYDNLQLAKLSEGTTASIIRKQAVQVCPDSPSATVDTGDKAMSAALSWILNEEILPLCNEQYPYLNKCQLLVEFRSVYGIQFAEITKSKNINGLLYPDFRLNQTLSVALEPGAESAYTAKYIVTIRYYTKQALLDIIEDGNDDTWDYTQLTKLSKLAPANKEYDQEPLAKQVLNLNNESDDGYRLVTIYQKSKDAPIYTYSPQLNKVVREQINEDPLGDIPFIPSYHHVTLNNPYGKGIAEILLGFQNYIDEQFRLHAYASSLSQLPPFKAYNVTPDLVNLYPLGLTMTDAPPNESIFEPIRISDKSTQQFQTEYAQIRALMFELVGMEDVNTSAAAGVDFSSSKTATGVRRQAERQDTTVRQLRHNLEKSMSEIMKQLLYCFIYSNDGIGKFRITPEVYKVINENRDEDMPISVETDQGFYMSINFDEMKKRDYNAIGVTMSVDPDWNVDKNERTNTIVQLLNLIQQNPRFEGRIKFEEWIMQIMKDNNLEYSKFLLTENETPLPQIMTPEATAEMIRQTIQEEGSSADKARELEIKQQEVELKKQELAIKKQELESETEIQEAKIKADYLEKTNRRLPADILDDQPETPEQQLTDGVAEIIRDAEASGLDNAKKAQIGSILSQIDNGILTPEQARQEIERIKSGTSVSNT